MYSGQGSHYYQMGKELYENHSLFRQKVDEFDAVASEILGLSLVTKIYDPDKGKGADFDQVRISSLAIIMMEYGLTCVLIENGIIPDYILGASIGEICGMLVAGVKNLRECIEETDGVLRLFEDRCEKGGMIGILDTIDLYENTPLLRENSEIAAINFDSHFVISCRKRMTKTIENYLSNSKISYQTLSVSLGFHSSLFDPAKDFYNARFGNLTWKSPQYPIFSCTSMKEVFTFDNDYFWNILRKPIMFQKTVQRLEEKQECCYVDVGPSGTFATFVKYNLRNNSKSEIHSILTPFGRDLQNLDSVQRALSNRRNRHTL